MQLAAARGASPAIAWAIWTVVTGVSSAVGSFIAAGLDYIRWEQSGELVSRTPDWIVAWGALSLLAIMVGLALLILAALRRRSG